MKIWDSVYLSVCKKYDNRWTNKTSIFVLFSDKILFLFLYALIPKKATLLILNQKTKNDTVQSTKGVYQGSNFSLTIIVFIWSQLDEGKVEQRTMA